MKRKAKKTKKNKIDPNFVPKPAVYIKQGVSLEDDLRNRDAQKRRFTNKLK